MKRLRHGFSTVRHDPVGGPALVALVIALGWGLYHLSTGSGTSDAATSIHLFTPTNFAQSAPLPTPSHDRGTCLDQSNVDPAPEAVRCFGRGGSIYDPCWQAGVNEICANSPWATSGTRFHVDRWAYFVGRGAKEHEVYWDPNSTKLPPLENGENKRWQRKVLQTTSPWALALANGYRCVFISGASGTIAGLRVNYACNRSGIVSDDFSFDHAVWVVGAPDRTESPWVVYFQAPDGHTTTAVALKDAWY